MRQQILWGKCVPVLQLCFYALYPACAPAVRISHFFVRVCPAARPRARRPYHRWGRWGLSGAGGAGAAVSVVRGKRDDTESPKGP
jgi:hypothetical protein